MKKIWKIKIGGQPESGRVFDIFEDVEDYCLLWAQEIAEKQGVNLDEIDLWYDETKENGGACPRDEDGAYWPRFYSLSNRNI